MIKNINGSKTRVCNEACGQSFKEDRDAGLNYGLTKVNGVFCMDREEYSLATNRCAYCGEHVPGPIPEKVRAKFNISCTEEVHEQISG